MNGKQARTLTQIALTTVAQEANTVGKKGNCHVATVWAFSVIFKAWVLQCMCHLSCALCNFMHDTSHQFLKSPLRTVHKRMNCSSPSDTQECLVSVPLASANSGSSHWRGASVCTFLLANRFSLMLSLELSASPSNMDFHYTFLSYLPILPILRIYL